MHHILAHSLYGTKQDFVAQIYIFISDLDTKLAYFLIYKE